MPPSPTSLRKSIQKLRHRCRAARQSYECALSQVAFGEPLLSALPQTKKWIDVVRKLGHTSRKLAQHEKWFARAEEFLVARISRGRPRRSRQPETHLLKQLIPVFEYHTGLAATPSAAGTTPFMRFFRAVQQEAKFPTSTNHWAEHIRKLIPAEARGSVLPQQMWSDLNLGD